jgi:hypothetical protein
MQVRGERKILLRSWAAQQLAIDAIHREGFGSAFNITHHCFAKISRPLTCIDGRADCTKIAIPGAGVLLDDEGRVKTAELLKKAGVEISGVRPHKNCGAEKEAMRLLTAKGLSRIEVLAEITRRYQHMAKLLGVNVKSPAAMKNSHFHNERSLVISGVDHMDPSGFLDFHPFLINARFMPSIESALEAVPFCVDIAFGNNGYGKRHFLRKIRRTGKRGERSKFLIVIIGSPFKEEYSCQSLRQRLNPYISPYRNMISIVNYNVPGQLLK